MACRVSSHEELMRTPPERPSRRGRTCASQQSLGGLELLAQTLRTAAPPTGPRADVDGRRQSANAEDRGQAVKARALDQQLVEQALARTEPRAHPGPSRCAPAPRPRRRRRNGMVSRGSRRGPAGPPRRGTGRLPELRAARTRRASPSGRRTARPPRPWPPRLRGSRPPATPRRRQEPTTTPLVPCRTGACQPEAPRTSRPATERHPRRGRRYARRAVAAAVVIVIRPPFEQVGDLSRVAPSPSPP